MHTILRLPNVERSTGLSRSTIYLRIKRGTELGLATVEKDGVRIVHEKFSSLEAQHGIDAFDGLVPWTPFAIEIETTGWPGGESFRYFYRFYSGKQPVNLERIGCFVRRGRDVYRLDLQTFSLIEAIDAFNILPPESKANREAFVRFAEVKELAHGVGAQLDAFELISFALTVRSIPRFLQNSYSY